MRASRPVRSDGCGRADRRVIAETDRLTLRPLCDDDAPFILALLNDPSFVEFIGDKGVRTIEDALEYIRTGARDGYARRALFLAARKADGAPVGMCSLVKRAGLDAVDIGFAMLSPYRGCGYATEAAAWTMSRARQVDGAERLLAITTPGNVASARVLGKLGFRFIRRIRLKPDAEELQLFESTGGSAAGARE